MPVARMFFPWMAWSPKGDRIAYFVRTEKERSLIVQNVLTTKIESRVPIKTLDEPESPCFAPDGRAIAFAALRGAVGDIYTINLETKDMATPIDAEVVKNGNIYNIWTLDLRTGELRQYTDALGGNLSAVVLNEGKTSRIAFVTYYKGEYGIHTLERKEPLHTASTSDFGAPGPLIDFQAPLQHTLVTSKIRKKGTF